MMEVLEMSVSKIFGIKETEHENQKYLLELEYNNKFLNHLGTMHASMIYSLAEISSGYFLKKNFSTFSNTTIPNLRTSVLKYKKPCISTLYSKARLLNTNKEEILLKLTNKKNVLFTIEVLIYCEDNILRAKGNFEWYISPKK